MPKTPSIKRPLSWGLQEQEDHQYLCLKTREPVLESGIADVTFTIPKQPARTRYMEPYARNTDCLARPMEALGCRLVFWTLFENGAVFSSEDGVELVVDLR